MFTITCECGYEGKVGEFIESLEYNCELVLNALAHPNKEKLSVSLSCPECDFGEIFDLDEKNT